MSRGSTPSVFRAVIITIFACSIVFVLALYFFESDNQDNRPIARSPVSSGLVFKANEAVVIPIPIDNTNIEFSGTDSFESTGLVIVSTGSVVSDSTGTTMECTHENNPVCGSGVTYTNACMANSSGALIVVPGACKTIATTSTGSSGSLSIKKSNTPVCPMEYIPICGVDNKTYSNSCMAGDVVIAHIGECDTTERKIFDSGSYLLYSNTGLGYGFAMPKYSYYSGNGAHDGANHAIAIATTASGITDFANAPVQVWFYKNPPTNPPSEQFSQTKNGILYIKNNDTTNDKKIKNIVETILESVN